MAAVDIRVEYRGFFGEVLDSLPPLFFKAVLLLLEKFRRHILDCCLHRIQERFHASLTVFRRSFALYDDPQTVLVRASQGPATTRHDVPQLLLRTQNVESRFLKDMSEDAG